MRTVLDGMETAGETMDEQAVTKEPLQFTGNWFIDAGILGFVNLMEEVYGWDLEKLQTEIKENTKAVYCWYFPIAFVYYNNKLRGKVVKSTPPGPPLEGMKDAIDIFEESWGWICSKEEFIVPTKQGKRVDLSFKKPFNYFTNLLFFQPNWTIEKQKDAFMEILGLKNIEKEVLKYIDKTINKFLPSLKEFGNIPYTKTTLTLETLLNLHPYSLVYTLCFPLAFIQNILQEDIFFYSPDLKFTHYVNKRITNLVEKAEDRSRLIQITWKAVIDSIMELQSVWILENMYLIKYRLGGRQDIVNAEYIGIPKLQASIILDDLLREALNKNIPTSKRERGRVVWVWILEKFIQNKPLLPYLVDYLHEYLSERLNIRLGNRTLIYVNSVDAQLRELIGRDNNLFSDEFFNKYRSTLPEIKENAVSMLFAAKNAQGIFDDQEERKRTAGRLLSTIRKRNKYTFANMLLKLFIGKDGKQREIQNLNRYLFDKIVSNDINWENYALAIVIGLVYGGVEDGELGEVEE